MPTELGAAARCEDLVKTYRTADSVVTALEGVTVAFAEGAVTALAGPSGSGKSTLLRLLAGLDRPTSGALVVGGIPLHRASSMGLRRLRRRTVGYVFQRASDNFYPFLTVREHLDVALRAAGPHAREDPDELLERLGIAHRAGHRPAELSGGEQARAAVAQALVRGARLVVADEPTAELDSASGDGVVAAISELAGTGVTFVLATHDHAVMRRADDVVELDHGRLRPHLVRRVEPDATARRVQPDAAAYAEPNATVWRPPPPKPDVVPDEPVVLEARAVTKRYRRGDEVVDAVRGASLDLRAGELVALVGRSGSGKTTLLNLAAGWERPDGGRVEILGRDPSGPLPPWSEVSVLPQRLGLIEELTVRENIEYPARLAGTLEQTTWLVDRLVEALGLGALQHRYPKETSVGEQQRTAVARALVLSPRLVLADEPTGHQNVEWRDAVFETIQRAVEEGTSCLAATHDEDIVRHVHRVLSMTDGVVDEQTATA